MNLIDTFNGAIRDAKLLMDLYDALLTTNQRAIRPEWAQRFKKARLTPWLRTERLWRSTNGNVLIVGKASVPITHEAFQAESLAVLVRCSLVLHMAAIDKVLHEALSKNFSALARSGSLDDLVDVTLSRAYEAAQNARVRTGKGGKIKKRPGHELKREMLKDIFRDSYLSTLSLEKVCAACGHRQIFKRFERAHPAYSAEFAREQWAILYARRNSIAHECDIVRKSKPRRVQIHEVNIIDMRGQLHFLTVFGRFLANTLN